MSPFITRGAVDIRKAIVIHSAGCIFVGMKARLAKVVFSAFPAYQTGGFFCFDRIPQTLLVPNGNRCRLAPPWCSCWTASRHINRLGWNFMLLSRNCKEPTVQIDHQGSSGLLFDGQIQYAPSTRGTACFVHEREIMPIKKQLLSKWHSHQLKMTPNLIHRIY